MSKIQSENVKFDEIWVPFGMRRCETANLFEIIALSIPSIYGVIYLRDILNLQADLTAK